MEIKGSLKFLADRQWWKDTLQASLRFAPRCFAASFLVTASMVAANTANALFIMWLEKFRQGNLNEGSFVTLFTAMGVNLVVDLLAIIVALVGVTIWLMRLHAFAHVFTSGSTADEAFRYVKGLRKFLAMFWTVATVYLLLPVLAACALIALRITVRLAQQPEWTIEGESMLKMPEGFSNPAFLQFCDWGSGVLGVLILAYSMVALVFSTLSPTAPARLATSAFTQFLRHFPSVMLVTLVVVALNWLVSAPLTIAMLVLPQANLDQSWVFLNVVQVWAGLTSTFMWPLTVAPYCMMSKATPQEVSDGQPS